MAKLTEKLNEALKTLGEKYDPQKPNIVVYAKLAERNYVWDGERWARHGFSELSYPALIRVQGKSYNDCAMLSDAIATVLHAGGYRVTLKPAREEYEGGGYRQYLEVE